MSIAQQRMDEKTDRLLLGWKVWRGVEENRQRLKKKKRTAIFPARHWFISPVPEKTLPLHKPPNLSSPDSQHIYIQKLNMPVSTICMHTHYAGSPAADPAGHHKKKKSTHAH